MDDVEISGSHEVPAEKLVAARGRIENLQRYTSDPLEHGRLTVRKTHSSQPWVVDSSIAMDGRVLAAHTAGRSVDEAVDQALDRLREQIVRVSEKRDDAVQEALPFDQVLRPEPSPKPPEQRQIIRRHTYLSTPLPTFDALDELYDLDLLFFLFHHVRGDDPVVYRRDDGRPGLIYPPGSVLADENDVVVAEESWFSEPLTLEKARTEMDFTNHRFLYFTAAEDGRGRVLFLRHDGDYGLVEPG